VVSVNRVRRRKLINVGAKPAGSTARVNDLLVPVIPLSSILISRLNQAKVAKKLLRAIFATRA
jgi:hypothetical protein